MGDSRREEYIRIDDHRRRRFGAAVERYGDIEIGKTPFGDFHEIGAPGSAADWRAAGIAVVEIVVPLVGVKDAVDRQLDGVVRAIHVAFRLWEQGDYRVEFALGLEL